MTQLHTNCGTCTECARIPSVVKYTCPKGGHYKVVSGYVGNFNDICRPIADDTILLKCAIVGGIAWLISFYAMQNIIFSNVVCILSATAYWLWR
jgi:hypothetical protein